MQLTIIAVYQKCLLCICPSDANSGVLPAKRKPMESSIKPGNLLLRWNLTLAALIPETGEALKLKHFQCSPFLLLMGLTVHLPQWCTLLSACICMSVHRADLLLCKLTNCWPPVAELHGTTLHCTGRRRHCWQMVSASLQMDVGSFCPQSEIDTKACSGSFWSQLHIWKLRNVLSCPKHTISICHGHSNSSFLWRISKRFWEFTWQQLDPEEAFQILHRLPFHGDPLSPCCTQAAEESFASGTLWMVFLHNGTWFSQG